MMGFCMHARTQRRREKINDKLRTLQQLTPMCSKTDKASTLEEVIKYVKSLQHQVQVMSAPNGYAMPTPILPPPCMHLPAGDVLGGKAPPAMLPLYPVYPMVYARPHNGTPVPMPALAPYAHRHPGEPAGSGGARQQLLDPRRHLVPNDLITGKNIELRVMDPHTALSRERRLFRHPRTYNSRAAAKGVRTYYNVERLIGLVGSSD
nr:putative transcription factor bHLH056 [Lolium perenne]